MQGNTLIDNNDSRSFEPGSMGDALNNLDRDVPVTAPSGTIILERHPDGHFYADMYVNGALIRFLVDTGASMIVLRKSDASRAGIATSFLQYSGIASTANGEVKIAPTMLTEIVLDGLTDHNMDAFVSAGEMTESLLGMTYLSKFSQIEIVDNKMILHR